MVHDWSRRALLASLGASTLAGCVADVSGEDDPGEKLPDECPKTQGIDVEWPEDLDADAAASFVETYEHRYYRDVVVEYEPSTRLDSYEVGVTVVDGPTEVDEGYEVELSGGGGIYTPTLWVETSVTDPPDGADLLPADGIDDEELTEVLVDAAEDGGAEFEVVFTDEIDRYVDVVASLSEDDDPLTERGDEVTLYVDVDGTAVELSVRATSLHGDLWWDARYYVDEYVVRRTPIGVVDPEEELLECRDP